MKYVLSFAALAVAIAPGIATAQALVCKRPANPSIPVAELPSEKEPARVLPIGAYTLAVTWTPEVCRNSGFTTASRFQCGSGNRFGFSLHGLWPDGVGKEWPQYCTRTSILPPAVIRGMMCSTPSAQLIQHEWAKHGTCTGQTPSAYFAQSSALYAKLRYPDMNALSRRPLTVGRFQAAFAAVNPGIPADAVRVTAKRGGWLDELWLCLDTKLNYTRCRAGTGGLSPDATLKIWRGRSR